MTLRIVKRSGCHYLYGTSEYFVNILKNLYYDALGRSTIIFCSVLREAFDNQTEHGPLALTSALVP